MVVVKAASVFRTAGSQLVAEVVGVAVSLCNSVGNYQSAFLYP